ncbi:C6 transcription factor, putative [Glarea lozoyensis ATCC 20868]|uniref:C6 transcription factor, putative n=1 Tax=Glarea lozoyensis (strain ATCC 20868 / MF5171) TaxID=1116229 RepID=S3D5X0_GLAL2|nr:C6 transcription factor, putative [Glarea lozoyensis ATCC 20868]EPE32529.1 C6 transcription factor, putative [Glarea lozoyensis ATCC 20868]
MPALSTALQDPQGTTAVSHTSAASFTLASSDHLKTPISHSPNAHVEGLQSRIQQLEEQLSEAISGTMTSRATTTMETTSSRLGGTFHFNLEGRTTDTAQGVSRSVMHKKRMFGQSHWLNFRDTWEMIDCHLQEETSKTFSGLQECKSLARAIKFGRSPLWPLLPTVDLPSKDICDELLDCYLQTTELVYRILHVPTFRKEYDELWIAGRETQGTFRVQLKLVLAIGAATYDDKFSMRTSAIKWVYEAQTWLTRPEGKSHLDVGRLQTRILLLIAREIVDIGGDSTWILSGDLYRRAMNAGLHRDPSSLPTTTVFVTEMHRRLWNSILEICIQSSMTCGGPPLISLDDFNTQPPSNLDDDQLTTNEPIPKPEEEMSQVSIAIALRKTFPIRLAIAKFLNDLHSNGTYEETICLDKQFRACYKVLCRTVQGPKSNTGSSTVQPEVYVVEFVMSRYLSSLHTPFFGRSLYETSYAYSRKAVVENSLKIWRASQTSPLNRLAVCGSGFYETVAFQAALLVAVEIRTQLQEEESLGPVSLRPDLVAVVDNARTWCLQRIKSGETNIKGYLLIHVVTAQIDALRKGVDRNAMPSILVQATQDVEDVCLPILEEMASQAQVEENADGLADMSFGASVRGTEDWGFMMSDPMFISENSNPLSWMFDDEFR